MHDNSFLEVKLIWEWVWSVLAYPGSYTKELIECVLSSTKKNVVLIVELHELLIALPNKCLVQFSVLRNLAAYDGVS